jgi:hypothetical protein
MMMNGKTLTIIHRFLETGSIEESLLKLVTGKEQRDRKFVSRRMQQGSWQHKTAVISVYIVMTKINVRLRIGVLVGAGLRAGTSLI